jgi:glycosyltransferase involved in cell wall biosynthesis
MRVLFLSSHHGTGASETLWIDSAARLAKAGYQVWAAVNWRRRSQERLAPLIDAGVTVRYLKFSSESIKFANLMSRFLPHGKWELFVARRVIAKASPDMIVFSQGNDISALPFMELANSHNIPYQIITHGLNPSDWPSDNIADRLRSVFKSTDRSYWVAARNIEEFEHHIGVKLTNAEVVRNPVKVDRNTQFAWPAETGLWRMACVARLQTRVKGHDLLIQALAAPEWRERPFELTLFGDGENRRGLERLASMLGIAAQISFGGHVSKVESIWNSHHIIMQPSRNEGMPLALVEALMCGRPALVTDVAGHSELIADGVNGFVAEAPTVRHIGLCLERAWDKRHCWEGMGRAAYARIREDVPSDPSEKFVSRIIKVHSASD